MERDIVIFVSGFGQDFIDWHLSDPLNKNIFMCEFGTVWRDFGENCLYLNPQGIVIPTFDEIDIRSSDEVRPILKYGENCGEFDLSNKTN